MGSRGPALNKRVCDARLELAKQPKAFPLRRPTDVQRWAAVGMEPVQG
jgi:hypothetical protein